MRNRIRQKLKVHSGNIFFSMLSASLIFTNINSLLVLADECKSHMTTKEMNLIEMLEKIVDSESSIKKISAAKIDSTKQELNFHHAKEANFSLSADILNAGDVQVYSRLIDKKAINAELSEMIKKLDVNNIFEGKGDKVSYLKIAYVIPKTKAENFKKEITTSKDYIEKTNMKIKFLKAKKGDLRLEKEVPVFDDVQTEFLVFDATKSKNDINQKYFNNIKNLNSGVGAPTLISMAELVESTDPILEKSVSFNHYYDLPDQSGTLVVTHTLADINIKGLGFIKRNLLNAIPESIRVRSMEEETGFLIKKNRQYFKGK